MTFLAWSEKIDIEIETVAAILKSVLRARGDKKRLARTVGISEVYLSYVLNQERTLSIETARAIARLLPLPFEQREAWIYHVEQIRNLRQRARIEIKAQVKDRISRDLVDEVRRAHASATFAQAPSQARPLYLKARASASLLLNSIDPEKDPINYLELCFVIHDALCVLNRNDDALWYGKQARLIANGISDPHDFGIGREQLDFYVVNAFRAEAVAFHNLKLNRQAYRLCQELEERQELKRNVNFWKPHVYRDEINALEAIPRFAITAAENMADQVRDVCEQRANDFDPLLLFLIQGSLARAYIRHRNYKDAYRVLDLNLQRLDKVKNVGALHRVIFFRTFARFYSAQNKYGEEWRYFVREFTRIATNAGLEHQLSEMRAEVEAAKAENQMLK